jgi:parallel beta-helix repeat protein
VSFGRSVRAVACCAASVLVFGLVSMGPAAADHGRGHGSDPGDRHGSDHDHGRDHDHGHDDGLIFVSPSGSNSARGRSCESATFTSIGAAVAAARAGGTVVVCRGTYREDVLVDKPLKLRGDDARIDAAGLENGIQVVSSRVAVLGFTIANANGEGVLVGVDSLADAHLLPASGPVLHNVTVSDNDVSHNNKGFNGTENGNCKYAGDCGGGIHLNVTTGSVVRGNVVNSNSDGILLTDDYGPSSYNLVERNVVDHNLSECGIVLPSHSSNAVTFDPKTFEVTAVNPNLGGVYGNIVRENTADDNGTDKAPPQFGGGGSGSGIGLFGSGPGSAVYDNVVDDNEATGNGLAGITIHAHLPGGEDINGNVFTHNRLGTNNLGGDGFDGPPTMDFQTTGIAVYSAVAAHMTIADNHIRDNVYGIWLSKTITAHGLDDNRYRHVGTKVFVG